MNTQNEMEIRNQKKEKGGKRKKYIRVFKKYFTKKIIIGIVILLCIITGAIGLEKNFSFYSKTTKIGFEDMGEFATQSAYCTEVNVTDKERNLFGRTIPFTQSKYIYSYDIVIKAGFNFEDIEWDKNGTSIEVKLPEAKVLSSEINWDSFKIYHENDSIFTEITMTEKNEAMKELNQKAEEDAIANGLLDNARENAEKILTSFFAKAYDLGKYEIIFKDI